MSAPCPNLRDAPAPPNARLPEGHWWVQRDRGGLVRDGEGLVWESNMKWVCAVCDESEPPPPIWHCAIPLAIFLVVGVVAYLISVNVLG